MSSTALVSGAHSRRTFLRSACVGAAALATMGVAGIEIASAATGVQAFRIDYDDTVWVMVSSGDRFDVSVIDRDGAVLEHHRRLTTDKLLRIDSGYFDVAAIEPPRAA